MSAWGWAGIIVVALLLGPIILVLFVEFMYWWLDNTVGRILDRLGL